MSDDPYLYVRQARPDLYQEIVAFSATVNLQDELQARASIEKFCMHLVDACKYALAILLSLLFAGVVEAKEVVIQYDDFLAIMATKEHRDKLLNQCKAGEVVRVQIDKEKDHKIELLEGQIKNLLETAETQEQLGATEAQINEALQKQLAKVTQDLENEKSQKYWSALGGFGVGVAVGVILMMVVN